MTVVAKCQAYGCGAPVAWWLNLNGKRLVEFCQRHADMFPVHPDMTWSESQDPEGLLREAFRDFIKATVNECDTTPDEIINTAILRVGKRRRRKRG